MTRKKEYKHQITELYRLLSITLIIFGGLVSATTFLLGSDRVTEINKNSPLAILLLVPIIFIFIYVLYLLFALMFEYMIFSNKNREPENIKLLDKIRRFSYFGLYLVFAAAFFILVLLFLSIIVLISWKLGLILFIVIVFFSLCGYFLGEYIVKRQKTTPRLGLSLVVILFIGLMFSVLFIYSYENILFYSSNFDIVYDKNTYFNGDSVYIQIYPRGFTRPRILNITYHDVPLNYTWHEDFLGAPVFLTIPSEVLKFESYNSYIKITYRYRTDYNFSKFLRRIGLSRNPISYKEEFIPIFMKEDN